jgi:outer membrane protein
MIALSAVALLCSCNGKDTNKADEKKVETTSSNKESGVKIAFVVADTISNQYQYYVDMSEKFEKKQANAEASIASKTKTFQSQAQEFQRKLQSNQLSEEQYKSESARLGKMQQDIEALQQRLGGQLQEETIEAQNAIHDTIDNFLASYAKEKGYDFIFTKSSQINTVLYANSAYDITDEVVKALNKRYEKDKKNIEKKESKDKEEKKDK